MVLVYFNIFIYLNWLHWQTSMYIKIKCNCGYLNIKKTVNSSVLKNLCTKYILIHFIPFQSHIKKTVLMFNQVICSQFTKT